MKTRFASRLLPLVVLTLAVAAHGQAVNPALTQEQVSVLTGGILQNSLPADFPLQKLPDGIRVVASYDQQSSVRVMLESTMPLQESVIALEQALQAKAWLRLAVYPAATPPPSRFATPGQSVAGEFCKEGIGLMKIRVAQAGKSLELTLNRMGSLSGCTTSLQQRQQPAFSQ